MVVVELSGGLGNQMFQYALARQLALLNNTHVELDLTELLRRDAGINYTFRDYALNVFNVKCGVYKKTFVKNVIDKIFPFVLLNENGFGKNKFEFDETILNVRNNKVYLRGFWQNEKYFQQAALTIREDFVFKSKLTQQNEDLLSQMLVTDSVSIHFRRGDYVSLVQANDFHGICTQEYYIKAIDVIAHQVTSPHFFIFSDDIEWVRNNVNFNHSHTFVTTNTGSNSHEDMRLMANCKHNIIANSSFSWWGAWLNKHPGKIVIAPQRWFNNVYTDIIPDTWVKV